MGIVETNLKGIMELHSQGKLHGAFNISNADYHAAPGLSKSALDLININPEYYQLSLKDPDSPLKESLIFGSAYHCKLLEPEKFNELFYLTKTQPREAEYDSSGRMPLAERHLETIEKMRTVFMADQELAGYLNGYKEISFFATHPDTGILIKAKLDIVLKSGVIIDLKTCNDISDEKLSSTMAEYRYHVQASFGLSVVNLAKDQANDDFGIQNADAFVLCSQSKGKFHQIDREPVLEESILTGTAEYTNNLNTYAECVKNNEWPGTKSKVVKGRNLPFWYIQKIMNKEG